MYSRPMSGLPVPSHAACLAWAAPQVETQARSSVTNLVTGIVQNVTEQSAGFLSAIRQLTAGVREEIHRSFSGISSVLQGTLSQFYYQLVLGAEALQAIAGVRHPIYQRRSATGQARCKAPAEGAGRFPALVAACSAGRAGTPRGPSHIRIRRSCTRTPCASRGDLLHGGGVGCRWGWGWRGRIDGLRVTKWAVSHDAFWRQNLVLGGPNNLLRGFK